MSSPKRVLASQSSSVYGKYPSDYQFCGKRVLNLGCGFSKFNAPNVTNLDTETISDPNVVWDLEKTPLPFQDETFDFIIANHILEHVRNWWDCFEDCARILKEGGQMEIWLPGNGNDTQMGLRDHVSLINHCSFWGTWGFYRNPGNAWAAANNGNHSHKMVMIRIYQRAKNYWWMKLAWQSLRDWMSDHLRNVSFEQGYVFRKLSKEQMGTQVKPDYDGNGNKENSNGKKVKQIEGDLDDLSFLTKIIGS